MSDIREQKQVTQLKEVVVGCKCDNCGKIVNGDRPKDWINFNSHHDEWGSDSGESFVYYDACSPQCFLAIMSKALEELKGYEHSAEISEMPYEFAARLVQEFKPSHTPPDQ